MTQNNEVMIVRHAPADSYLPFAATLLDIDIPGTAGGFIELAEMTGWPLVACDDDGAVLGNAWPGMEDLPWKAAFADGALASFWTPIGHADQPAAAAQLFAYALAKAEPALGPPQWTSTEFYVRAWQGTSGIVMLDSVKGQLRLEFVPYRSIDAGHGLTPTWEGLHDAITAEVGRWAQNECMIFSFGGHCVQLIQEADAVHIEIPEMNPQDSWLSAEQQQQLAAQKWLPPQPPGWFCWRQQLPYRPGPQFCTQVAELVVHALRDLCHVDSPAALEFQAFNVHGGATFPIGIQPPTLLLAKADASWRHGTAALTQAGIEFAKEKIFPAGSRILCTTNHPPQHRVSQPIGDHQAPGADLLLWTGGTDARLIAVHVVPADCTLAAKLVPDPNNPRGPYLNVEQGCGAYLRDLLENNPDLDNALGCDPELRTLVTQHLSTLGVDGISSQKLAIDSQGTLHTSEFRIDLDSFGTHPIRPGSRGDSHD